MTTLKNEKFFTEYKLSTPSFKMPDEVYERDALLEYKQALEHWDDKIKTPEQALIRVVDWRRLMIKLRKYASNPFVAKSLEEAMEYLAKAEQKVEEMKPPTLLPPPRVKPSKPPAKSLSDRPPWRDHWVPPMSW
jgi:hypothetical protein